MVVLEGRQVRTVGMCVCDSQMFSGQTMSRMLALFFRPDTGVRAGYTPRLVLFVAGRRAPPRQAMKFRMERGRSQGMGPPAVRKPPLARQVWFHTAPVSRCSPVLLLPSRCGPKRLCGDECCGITPSPQCWA
eukprot:114680-Chlamydomonas_euryale.AAC.2